MTFEREPLERRAHHDVGELVVDDPHLDAPVRGVDERLLEALADRVALPDVGLEQDLLLGSLDRGQHVVVQVLAEGVRRHGPVPDRRLLRRPGRERLGLLAAAAVGVDQAHRDRDHQRDPEDDEQRPLDHHRHRVGVVDERVPGGHAAIQPERSCANADGDLPPTVPPSVELSKPVRSVVVTVSASRRPPRARRACRRSRAPAGAARGASSARRAGRGPRRARVDLGQGLSTPLSLSSTPPRVWSTAPSLVSTVPSTPSTFFRALSARLRMSPTGLSAMADTLSVVEERAPASVSKPLMFGRGCFWLTGFRDASLGPSSVGSEPTLLNLLAHRQPRELGCRCSDVRSLPCVQSPISSAGWRPSR